MGDKWYKRNDSKRCHECWRNRLKHGNKLKKKNGGTTRRNKKKIFETLPENEIVREFIKTDYMVRKEPVYEYKGPHMIIYDYIHSAKKNPRIRFDWGETRMCSAYSVENKYLDQNYELCSDPDY